MCHMRPYVPVNLAGYSAMIRVVLLIMLTVLLGGKHLLQQCVMFILSILPIHPIITYKFYLVYVY